MTRGNRTLGVISELLSSPPKVILSSSSPHHNPVSSYVNLTKLARVLASSINMVEEEWEGDFDPMADPDEQRHLLSVLDSFR